jgi:hypothetical protein
MLNSIRSFFNNPRVRRTYVSLRVPLAIIAIVAVFPFLRRDWLVAGFLVSMLGEFIQLWSFASLDKNSDLAIRGPYAMVQPMYLGRYLHPARLSDAVGRLVDPRAVHAVYWFT